MEPAKDGMPPGRYSIGWALLPLFGGDAHPQTVPMAAGTPRYLLLR